MAAAWAQVPLPPAPPLLRRRVLLAVGIIPVAAQVARLGTGRDAAIAALLAAAVLAVPAGAPNAVASAVALAVLLDVTGPGPAVVLIALLGLWRWVGTTPVATSSRSSAIASLLGPAAVASGLLVVRTGVGVPGAIVAIGLVERLVSTKWPSALDGVKEWLGSAAVRVGRVAGAVAMLPTAVVVLFGWAARRVVGLDPLDDGTTSSGGWRYRSGTDVHTDRLYGGDLLRSRPPARRRLRMALGSILVVATVGVSLAAVVRSTIAPDLPASTAFPDEAAFARVWADQQGFTRHLRFDPAGVYRYADFRSATVNQTNGVRRSWAPPACDCRRLRVWWYGGSAAWGFYQSDDDTPASMLAKAAWKQGVALDIENRAAPGYTISQEVLLFATASTVEQPPDIVIFYDGANEIDPQIERNAHGHGADESPAIFSGSLLERFYSVLDTAVVLGSGNAAGESVEPAATGPSLDAPGVATHAMNRYRRAVDLGRRVAGSVGTVAVFAWQPVQTTVPPRVYAPFEGTGAWPAQDFAWFGRLLETARRQLPAGTIDLSDAFDGEDVPLMPDWAHTNPRGAAIIGEALADRVVSLPAVADQSAG